MCTTNEYYNLGLESCLPCTRCADGEEVIKCSYFQDTVCQKEFWKGFVLLSQPLPTSPYVTRGPGSRTLEVLPEDWDSSPTVSMVISVLGLSLLVALLITLGCLLKKIWGQKKEKNIYLTRAYVGYRDPEEEDEPRYQPLPSWKPPEKVNHYSSRLYSNDMVFNMQNTHIYVNVLDCVDNDYCTIDDDFEER